VSGAVGGDAFASLFRRGVGDVHRAVFGREQDTATLTLVDVGIVVAVALQQFAPELADQFEGERVVLLERDLGGAAAAVARSARTLAFVLAALTLAAAIAAVAVDRDRRRAVVRLGLAVAAAGVATVVLEAVLGALASGEGAAAAAVWGAFFGDLRAAGWLIAATGAIVAAAAASLIRPLEVEARLRPVWRHVSTEPESMAARVARGAALIVVGGLVIVQPLATLRIVATLAGLYALYKGVEALLRITSRPDAPAPSRPRLRRLAVPAAATLLIAAAFGVFVAGGGADEPAPEIAGCNGHAALCDRRLDEVALPATHNSMSVPLPGWFASLQEQPISEQLADGIRGLLLDTHYADRLPDGRTRTYFADRAAVREAIEEDGVGARGVEAAERLRQRAGFRGGGERGMYLCHTFCELGSTPLADVLDDIREFLVMHPGDVLVMINQDYVTPADFVAAVDAAGLTRYAFEPPRGDEWPTLGEMVERDSRLVILAENEAGAAPWYQLVYERLTQETPFSFASPEVLTAPAGLAATCRPNRGPDGAPLLLVNHWINTDPAPRPSNAAIVNAYEPLLRRARTCQQERGQGVNLLAVDFYGRGDLFRVVDTLNGT
jgi:hypothetical protein